MASMFSMYSLVFRAGQVAKVYHATSLAIGRLHRRYKYSPAILSAIKDECEIVCVRSRQIKEWTKGWIETNHVPLDEQSSELLGKWVKFFYSSSLNLAEKVNKIVQFYERQASVWEKNEFPVGKEELGWCLSDIRLLADQASSLLYTMKLPTAERRPMLQQLTLDFTSRVSILLPNEKDGTLQSKDKFSSVTAASNALVFANDDPSAEAPGSSLSESNPLPRNENGTSDSDHQANSPDSYYLPAELSGQSTSPPELGNGQHPLLFPYYDPFNVKLSADEISPTSSSSKRVASENGPQSLRNQFFSRKILLSFCFTVVFIAWVVAKDSSSSATMTTTSTKVSSSSSSTTTTTTTKTKTTAQSSVASNTDEFQTSKSCKELFNAASEGDAETVKRLLGQGCSQNIKDKALYTPLHFAAKTGDVKTVSLFAHDETAAWYAEGGITPLHLAAKHGQRGAVKVLSRAAMRRGENQTHDWDAKAYDSQASDRLRVAARKKIGFEVPNEFYLSKSFTARELAIIYGYGNTALAFPGYQKGEMQSALSCVYWIGDSRLVTKFLKLTQGDFKMLSVHDEILPGYTHSPMQLAIMSGDIGILSTILRERYSAWSFYGYSVVEPSNWRAYASWAARIGSVPKLKLLDSYSAPLTRISEPDMRSPLSYAVEHDRLDAAEFLLSMDYSSNGYWWETSKATVYLGSGHPDSIIVTKSMRALLRKSGIII